MVSQQPTSTTQPQSLEEKLTTKHLAYLVETLHEVAPRCHAFGLQLGVDNNTLRKIKKENEECDEQLCEILDTRLKLAPLTMHNIVQALKMKSVGENELANKIVCQFGHLLSEAASQQVTYTNTTAPHPSTHCSVFQRTAQPTPSTQSYPAPRVDQHSPHVPVHVGNMYFIPLDPSQCNSPPNPLTPTPGQPQVETAQPPSSSQPSSSQLMSVPVTSQAMPGPSPQLNQDVATPHHLHVGEQQALQGQPPLQHMPSYEPQTVDQSYGTGYDSGSPQAKPVYCGSAMAQYINYVKTTYRKSVVERKSVSIKWPPTPSTVYINLVCVDHTADLPKDEADECTRAMVCDGSVDVILKKKTSIDFSDIARNVPDSKTLILVVGAPGVGKSTFAWEFCRRWERGEIAQQYQLVLLLRLRDDRMSKAQSFADLILHSSHHIRQAVVQELESTLGANTLIILEGFDELPRTCRTHSSLFFQLANGELLPNATVLVTSRPWATQDIHQECRDRIFLHIEILGFTAKQIEKYVTSVFTEEGKLPNEKAKENSEEIISYTKTYPQIRACMYIPLNSAIVVSVYQESKAGKFVLPKTLTQLYSALIQTLLLRYLYGHPEYGKKKWKIKSLKEDLPQDVYSKLLAVSELAYSGICTDQGNSIQLIFSNLLPDFETLGLMQSVPQLYVTQGEDMSYNFLHLTLQEFLAALHISNMSPEKQLEHFQRQEEGRWRVVLRFVAGLTKLASFSPDLLRGLLLKKPTKNCTKLVSPSVSLLKQPNEGKITWRRHNLSSDVKMIIQHVHWAFETQRDDMVPLLLQKRTVEFQCYKWLTPLDYYSLGYCISHSHSCWVLTVEDNITFMGNVFGEEEVLRVEEVKMLVAGANTRHDTTAKVVGLRGHDMHFGGRRFTDMGLSESSRYSPLSIPAEALNMLFVELKNVIHLQELHLTLPVECCSVAWPNLSSLHILHLALNGTNKWNLDTLLPHLSLQSLTIELVYDEDCLGLENAASIGGLFLSSNCPKRVDITDKWSPISAEVALGQHVHENREDIRIPLVEDKQSVECIKCCLDWYSLGCVIAHSNCQWVLRAVETRGEEEVIGEEEVRMLVAGANTRCDTSARVVGLKGYSMFQSDTFLPLSLSADALNVFFTELKNIIYMQELYLNLPAQCSSILWPNLSALQVLHLAISSNKNWRLDKLLPHLSLESLTIEITGDVVGLMLSDAASIGELFLSSNCPKQVHITDKQSPITGEVAVGQHVHEKQLDKITPSLEKEQSVECISCRLDWYSLGCVITHSNCQWVLTVEEDRWEEKVIGEEEVMKLVAGANTRCDSSARVVRLRGCLKDLPESDTFCPLSLSAEALDMLFIELKSMIHLQELHVNLPAQCSSIAWPNLSALQVLHLAISSKKNWKLDSLFAHLSLESLTIVTDNGVSLGLDNAASIGQLFLSPTCPKHMHITDEQSPIIAEVTVGQHVYETQLDNRTFLGEEKKSVECVRCRLDWYSLGCVIAHSNCQWVLTVEKLTHTTIEGKELQAVVGEEEVGMLVAGANTRCDTSAKVVGLRGGIVLPHFESGAYYPLPISAEALSVLFIELKNMIHLQELHLDLPAQCSNIAWPNLSGLRVLHLRMMDERNWRLDTLLPHLSLKSLALESTRSGGTVALEDYKAIGMLLSSTKCPLHFGIQNISIPAKVVQSVTEANQSVPLMTLGMVHCTFSDTAAHFLALFIANSTTLHYFNIEGCTFSAHGLLELAQAIHHNSSLWEGDLEGVTCTVDGDSEATECAQLLVDYPYMRGCWLKLVASQISDSGVESITALLSYNSTLRRLDLSGNDAMSAEGTRRLVQALTVNTLIGLVLPRRCEDYATQCQQYSEVKYRIRFR